MFHYFCTTVLVRIVAVIWATICIFSFKKQDGRCARVQTILLELISKGDRHFQLFCDSLVETNQSHVVTDYLSPNSVECFRHSLRRSLTCSAVDATGDHLATNWKTLLVKHRTDLTERITPNDDLVNYLEYSGVMNKHCAEHCRVNTKKIIVNVYLLWVCAIKL